MFIPIGDNIERRTFPLVTCLLIGANVLVFLVQMRSAHDAMDEATKTRAQIAAPISVPAHQAGLTVLAQNHSMSFDSNDSLDDFDSTYEPNYEELYADHPEALAEIRSLKAVQEAHLRFFRTWGIVPAEVSKGQVIGLLSYMFVHGDIWHILGNMLVLWAFAGALEAGFGHWTFLGFYILFGMAGGLGHVAANPASDMPMVGASGAVAGLIGAYTVIYGPFAKLKMLLFFFYRVWVFQMPAAAFGFGWFLLQTLQASMDSQGLGGVAWFAHIGGFLAGVVVAFVCRNDTEQEIVGEVDGRLMMQDRNPRANPPALAATAGAAPAADTAPPTACPYCQADLAAGHTLSPGLIRCGNEACQRMVYLELYKPMPEPTRRR